MNNEIGRRASSCGEQTYFWSSGTGLRAGSSPRERRFEMRCTGAPEKRRGHDVVRNCTIPRSHRAAKPHDQHEGG
jgi:hypothetical protein